MHGFRVTDPTGGERAAREASYEEFLRNATHRMFRMGPDGTMQEIDPHGPLSGAG